MAADLAGIAFFAPIAAFLIVFIVIFAILSKFKLIGENQWLNLFISFLIATIFVSTAGAVTYIQTIIPWFAVLLISLFLLLLMTGFIGKPVEFMNKGVGVAFVIILGLVFIVSGFFIFSDIIISYLPGPAFGSGENFEATILLDWLYSPRIAGAILLIAISAIVSWVLVRAK
jgi:hypothetical protein